MKRYSEWMDALNKQNARIKDVTLSDVTETLSLNRALITVTIGKGKTEPLVQVDGNVVAINFLRSLYTHNKEEFNDFLETITHQVDEVVEATETLMAFVSEDAVPEAVLERMMGDKTSGDPTELVKKMTEKKLMELRDFLRGFDFSLFKHFAIKDIVAGKELGLEKDMYGEVGFNWGNLTCDGDKVYPGDPEDGIFFLGSYDLIESRLEEIAETIQSVKLP